MAHAVNRFVKKETNMQREVRQMSPDEARAWCKVLRLNWITFSEDLVKDRSWVELLQIRANDQDTATA